ncbi:MAG TPA: glycosyltransferase family 4 protein [Puia sp.]|jgi:glycosyltransferase involved in cell wall biosynthesis|nr:glycosyltransferase family 4 protein [Puia sp.]
MTYKNTLLKRKLEFAGMLPFVLLGKLYSKIFPLNNSVSVFLFFSSADLGGAIKVNADIAQCISAKKPLIIFSKKPKNNGYLNLFEGFPILDLHKKIDNKLYHFVNFFYRGVLAGWINKSKNAIVFGGETLFFYKIIPHLKKDVARIELCHLTTWFPYSIGFIDLITHRIFSTKKLKEDAILLYKKNNIAQHFFDRLYFIENKITIPPYIEINNPKLEVVFVGRGAAQKRIHLIAAIAKKMHEMNQSVHFSFVGDVEKVMNITEYPYCTFRGNVRDEKLMNSIYQQSDVLILTSAYEGLPLVVMQMMAYGKVVLSTAVNGIPDYITHMQNGLLIFSKDEIDIVEEGVKLLQLLIENPELKFTLGKKSREIAVEKFNGELFCSEYNKLFK